MVHDPELMTAVTDALLLEGMSWRQLSKLAQVPERTLQNWRDGRTHIRLEQAVKMCRSLHLSLDQAVGLEKISPDPDIQEGARLMRLMPSAVRKSVVALIRSIAEQGPPQIGTWSPERN